MWFGDWGNIGEVVLSGTLMFVALLASIRLGGNRTLSNMNASDFIVTVAVGTTVASTMLSSDVPLASGAAAIVTLIGIQSLTIWLSVKFPRLRQRAEGEPIVLLHDGVPQRHVMKRAHVSMDELRQVVRQHGYGGFADVAVVLLEANGKFSVVTRSKLRHADALPTILRGPDAGGR
jgi:uncharacterized membrane protein YcaP (DUF421 family)